ncbi:MAG TPA: hypothetical protein VK582_25415 [Pyrinomonadaceae bacterium]|nr:hypothetical protein [Pyrinomonadaceae bacterium]
MDKVIYNEREMALIDPKPGTAAAAARDFGIDLSLTVSNLRLTPEQRIKQLDDFQAAITQLRKAVVLSKRHGRDRAGSEAIR